MKKSRSGFTLIELAIVIAVIAILVTIVVSSFTATQARSRDSRRKTDVANIIKAMELYYSDNGTYPIRTGPTGSSINDGWFVSSDGSWNMLDGLLVGSQAIDSTPVDPRNNPISPQSVAGYGYAIYVNLNSYCGARYGQMYLIIWRYELMPKERFSDGDCPINALGDSYYNNGNSYHRVVR